MAAATVVVMGILGTAVAEEPLVHGLRRRVQQQANVYDALNYEHQPATRLHHWFEHRFGRP